MMKTIFKQRHIIFALICTMLVSVYQVLWKLGAENISFDAISLINNYYLIFGFLLYGISSIFILLALKEGEFSIVYPILAFSFFIVTFLSHFILGEELSLLKIIGSFMILLGIIMISFESIFEKIFKVLKRRKNRDNNIFFLVPVFGVNFFDLNIFALFGALVAAFTNALGMFLVKKATMNSKKKKMNVLFIKELYVGAFTIVFGSFVYVFVLRFEDLSVLYPISSSQYIFGGLLAYYFLEERFGRFKTLGYILIILGIIINGS